MSTPITDEQPVALLVDAVVKVPHFVPTDDDEALLDEAGMLTAVTNATDYEYGADLVKQLAGAGKRVVSFFAPLKQAIDALKRPVLDSEKEHAGNYEREQARINKLCKAWFDAERAKEAEARAKAEREAEAKAKAERDAQAERLRAAAERVPDPAVAAAIKAEAAQVAASTPVPTKPAFTSGIPPVKGYTPSRVTYAAEGVDKLATIKGILAHALTLDEIQAIREELIALRASSQPVPLDAIEYNQKRLNQAATDSKEALRWPGVKVVKHDGTAARG